MPGLILFPHRMALVVLLGLASWGLLGLLLRLLA